MSDTHTEGRSPTDGREARLSDAARRRGDLAAHGIERRYELVQRLVKGRRQLGITQSELAAAMGASQSSVARLESGSLDPKLSTLSRYAAALGVSLRFDLALESDYAEYIPASQLSSADVIKQIRRAQDFAARNDFVRAREEWEKSLEVIKDQYSHAAAATTYAEFLYQQGDMARAQGLLEEALGTGDTEWAPAAHGLLALVRGYVGDANGALEAARSIPDHATFRSVRDEIVRTLREHGDDRSADYVAAAEHDENVIPRAGELDAPRVPAELERATHQATAHEETVAG